MSTFVDCRSLTSDVSFRSAAAEGRGLHAEKDFPPQKPPMNISEVHPVITLFLCGPNRVCITHVVGNSRELLPIRIQAFRSHSRNG